MTTQKQDLTFFHDNSIIPQLNERLLGVATHTQGTSPSWLINSLVENALYGTCHLNHDQPSRRSNVVADTVLISFLHNEKFFEKDLRKAGVETGEGFHFIDLFSDLFSKISSPASLEKTVEGIVTQIKSFKRNHKVLIIEGIEVLLAATPINATQLLDQIAVLCRASTSLFIITAADPELYTLKVANEKLPEFKMNEFLNRLAHMSKLNIALRPLDTGRAKDVTGTLTISRGAIPFKSLQVTEKEYLFLVSRDQTTKLFFR